jgi:hypothetical protein
MAVRLESDGHKWQKREIREKELMTRGLLLRGRQMLTGVTGVDV